MSTQPAIALPARSPLLADLPTEVIGYMVERMIDELDFREGDPDQWERNGDEADSLFSEDDFPDPLGPTDWFGPGCTISDPDLGIEDFQLAGDGQPGDPEDAEPTGDEEDTNFAEDELGSAFGFSGAGCPIADPGGCEHDGREEDYDV